jgi:hypothetical protein
MLVAALRDQLDRRVISDGLGDETRQRRAFQLEPMAASEESDEIRGGEDGPAIDELHRGAW